MLNFSYAQFSQEKHMYVKAFSKVVILMGVVRMEVTYDASMVPLGKKSLAVNILAQANSEEADFSFTTGMVVEFRANSVTFLQPVYSTL